MSSHQHRTSLGLVLHTLEPSAASVLTSLIVSIVLVLGHVVIISLHTGTIWPSYLGGYFAVYYTNYVVQPLLSFFNLGVVGVAERALIWSIIGGSLYALLEYAFHTIKGFYKTETSVQVVNSKIVRHLGQRSLIVHFIWRLVVGALAALFVYLALPFARYALHLDQRIVSGPTVATTIEDLARAIGIWLVLFQIAIILIRLYTFRTRLFGETNYN